MFKRTRHVTGSGWVLYKSGVVSIAGLQSVCHECFILAYHEKVN